MSLEKQIDQLEELKILHENGELADDEFQDLLQDLKRNVEVEEEAEGMILKSNIIKSIDLLLKIV